MMTRDEVIASIKEMYNSHMHERCIKKEEFEQVEKELEEILTWVKETL